MSQSKIVAGLKDYDQVQVETFANYCQYLSSKIDNKTGKRKNPWMEQRSDDFLISCFKQVDNEGLVFDGEHVTLQKTGISYDYQAYKNKMLLAYPESIIDDDLVYATDVFESSKESGKVIYSHEIINPFSREEKDIIGGYCVIKNKRGEFITLLSAADINKHRKVAKTDYIWKAWFVEMARKTIIKKACKKHFNDIYENIITMDNSENDIELPLNISLSVKQEIENIDTVEKLKQYFLDNKDKHVADASGFNTLINNRKKELAKNEDS